MPADCRRPSSTTDIHSVVRKNEEAPSLSLARKGLPSHRRPARMSLGLLACPRRLLVVAK